IRPDAGATGAGQTRCHRDASAADEPRRGNRRRHCRRSALGDPPAGHQWRGGAHGGTGNTCCASGRSAGALTMAYATGRAHRGTIFVEDAIVLSREDFAGRQHVLRVTAPETAARATAGSFVHVTVDPAVPMRRPLSIMRVDREAGWIELLFKIHGHGLQHLAARRAGDTVNLLGPIGRGFVPHVEKPRTLLIGGGVGIPPMVFLADTLRERAAEGFKPFAILGSELPFPFRARPSTIIVPGMPEGVIAAMPLLDGWSVPSRLTSKSGFPGCHDGYVTDLARLW